MKPEPHNPSLNADAEPTSPDATVPMWLITTMLGFLFLGAWVFDLRGGWFEPKVYAPYTSPGDLARFQPVMDADPAVFRGKAVFAKACEACHNTDGMGKPNVAPPLVGSEWVLAEKTDRLIRIPLYGLGGPITVSGKRYEFPSAMLNVGWDLPEQEVADVLTYIRQAWGNKAGKVTLEQVKAVKAEVGKRPNYTVEELSKVPDK